MFKVELKRVIKNPFTYAALLAGIVICLVEIIVDVIPELKFLKGRAIMEYPDTVFDKGMLFGISKFQRIYYTVIPLLAVIPGGANFYSDLKSGYIRHIVTRKNRIRYYGASYAVNFLTAGFVAVIPLIINFMICMALLPSTLPQPGVSRIGMDSENMFGELYYSMPYLYVFVYLAIIFVISGLIVSFAVSIAWVAFSKYLVLFIPFIIYYILHFSFQYIGHMEWSPLMIIYANQGIVPIQFWKVCVMIIALLSASIITFIVGGKKNEVL